MTYHTVLAVFDADTTPGSIVPYAKTIALRFDARVLGVVGGLPYAPLYFAEGRAGEEYLKQLKNEYECRVKELKLTVDSLLYNDGVPRQWSDQQPANAQHILGLCQAADIILTARENEQSGANPSASNLIMQAGRPVLLVSPHAHPELNRILVAWKDTREARRAIVDALPLLRKAEQVQVLLVDESDSGQGFPTQWNVVDWLSRHGVAASTEVRSSSGRAAGEIIEDFAKENGANLIVAGAYGRSRFMEWVFGGVTQHLAYQNTKMPVFFSH